MIQELQNVFMESLFPTQRGNCVQLYQNKTLVSQVLCESVVIQSHTVRDLISLSHVQREHWATCHDFVPWYISHGISFAAWTVFESVIDKGPCPDFKTNQEQGSFSQFCSSLLLCFMRDLLYQFLYSHKSPPFSSVSQAVYIACKCECLISVLQAQAWAATAVADIFA